MSGRDELIEVIGAADWRSPQDKIADAILAAGYRKARTITTVEGLATVYAGSIIVDDDLQTWGIDGATDRIFAVQDGPDETYPNDDIVLPAIVMWEPQP